MGRKQPGGIGRARTRAIFGTSDSAPLSTPSSKHCLLVIDDTAALITMALGFVYSFIARSR